jgi:hypothetical protein
MSKLEAVHVLLNNFKTIEAAEDRSGNGRIDVDSLKEIGRDGELNGTKFSEEVETACEVLTAGGSGSVANEMAGRDRFITADEADAFHSELHDT